MIGGYSDRGTRELAAASKCLRGRRKIHQADGRVGLNSSTRKLRTTRERCRLRCHLAWLHLRQKCSPLRASSHRDCAAWSVIFRQRYLSQRNALQPGPMAVRRYHSAELANLGLSFLERARQISIFPSLAARFVGTALGRRRNSRCVCWLCLLRDWYPFCI